MNAVPHLDKVLWSHFASGLSAQECLAPLKEAVSESSTLVLGYGGAQQGVRSELIPYFHVVGQSTGQGPLRSLAVGGWAGTERLASLTVARLVAAAANRLRIVSGMELTAYPVLNIEALEVGGSFTSKQAVEGVKLWRGSSCTQVRVLESELLRHPYDLTITLRETRSDRGFSVRYWPGADEARVVIDDALRRLSASGGGALSWEVADESDIGRDLTPIPSLAKQPTEIHIALPQGEEKQTSDLAIGLVLTLLHACRQARVEGVL